MTDEVVLEAPIKDVTVFQGKALVLREGEVDVQPGEHDILLKGLPMSISADSLRVSGEGLAGSKITGVEINRRYETEAPDVDRRELEERYKKAEEAQDILQEEVDELSRQISQLESASSNFQSDFPKALAYQKASIEDHRKFMEYIEGKRKDLKRSIRQKRKELEDAQKETDKQRGYLDLSASKDVRELNEVSIGVMAKAAGAMRLSVSYMVSGAVWEPVYDCRVFTDEDKVNLTYFGIVKQTTGEDWNDVGLILSTASHTEARELPELSPWYVSSSPPYSPSSSRSGKMRMAKKSMLPMSAPAGGAPPEAMMESDMCFEEEKEGMEQVVAEVEESGEAIVFKIQRKDTIPSDGQPKKLAVGILDLSCRSTYLAIPKLTPEAYLKARIKNDTEFVFLPGKVNLFQEDDFIGSTLIDTVAPKERFELSLGIARRIKVKRELVKKETDSAGILKGSRRITYGYKIKVENLKKAKARFHVKDQLPVPSHQDIKVEKVVLEPDPKKIDDMKIITWKFSLEPEKKRTIKMEFAVEHPTKMSIYGLKE